MKVVFSGTLLRFVDYSKEVDVEASTVPECIDQLILKFPGLRPVLLDGQSQVRETHQLFLNGEQLERRPTAPPPGSLGERDTLFIMTAIAGG
jgi:predicted phage tail protein